MKEYRRIEDLISMKGKRVMITGAGGGIGLATARRFAEAGASLYLIDIDRRKLTQARKSIQEDFEVDVETFKVDLSKKEEIDSLWNDLEGIEPDVLINNAGVYMFRDFLEIDTEFLEKMMKINFESVFWMCQNFIKRRIDKGGVIINVGSIEAIMPFAFGLVHYDVGKTGVLALTRALARDFSKKGFRINAVIPGGIETPGVKKMKKEAAMKLDIEMIKLGMSFKSRLPMGRFGKPDEVARVMLFLASDMASYITGALIPVDGGFLSA